MKYDFEIKEITRFDSTELIQTYHYSKIMPRLTKHFLGCFLDDELVGVLTLGWGTQPKATIAKLFEGFCNATLAAVPKLLLIKGCNKSGKLAIETVVKYFILANA